MIAERSGRDRASGGGGDGAGAQHAGHPDLEPIQYTFEPARVELAHWAHQMQVARAEMAHQPINDPDDPLLGTFDLLSHADVDAASPGARGAAIEPIRIARPVDHARDVVWDRTVEADTSIGKFEILSTDFAPPPREIVRGEPVSLETWRSWFHEGPRLPDETEEQACTRIGRLRVHPSVVREAIFRGGLENAVRPHAWRFLFGIFPWSSSVAERNQIRADRQARYMALKRAWKSQLQNLHDSASLGEHIVKDDLADNIMRIEKDVVRTDRGHPFFASSTVRQITQTDLQRPQSPTQAPLAGSSAARGAPAARTSLPNSGGASLPASPRSSTASTAPFGSQFRLTGHLEQLRDILVTYSTSPENDGLGFVQGMADLAAPILVVMKGNEADTYWCFVWMMERLKDNFRKDGSGMRRNLETMETMMRVLDPGLHVHLKVIDALNLFCCFRWFLVLFKREFEFDDVLRIWELWASDRYTTDLQHFIAMAILDEHRDAIVRHLLTFDEVLKYINDLSMNMRLDRILVRAEQLYLRFEGIARSRGCISDRDVEPFEKTLVERLDSLEL
ncbi:GTPase activating protein [Polyrhizophydium stewartii]|uniref:GTPase activating protein n=1 Tax=Polyrhizophydium stewartii TaxID=2732419 RepID=A0ABR4NDJ1_9FUNG